MRSIFNRNDVEQLTERIRSVRFDSKAKWGSFTGHQMICHLQDTLKYTLGQMEAVKNVSAGPPMFLRKIIGLYIPIPRAKAETAPQMLQTQPENWETDLKSVTDLLALFPESTDKTDWPMHPFFGDLDGKTLARINFRHIDHHLRQFGV